MCVCVCLVRGEARETNSLNSHSRLLMTCTHKRHRSSVCVPPASRRARTSASSLAGAPTRTHTTKRCHCYARLPENEVCYPPTTHGRPYTVSSKAQLQMLRPTHPPPTLLPTPSFLPRVARAVYVRTQLSYVGIMYLMLMKASSPPCSSNSSRVSWISSPRLVRLRWE